MGRRTKLTADRHERIIELIRNGNYRETAAQCSGIGHSTLYSWLERGEADQEADRRSIYRDFLEAIKEAEADAERTAVQAVRAGFLDDPKLALEYLSRKHPARWGKVNRTELSGPGGKPVEMVSVEGLSDEALAEIAAALGVDHDGAEA